MKNINITLISLVLILFCNINCHNNKNHSMLKGENWDSFNKKQIENLINKYGNQSSGYNSLKPPYVIFDWDNTSIYNDVADATLIYQLENLIFACNPNQLNEAIRTGITDKILKDTNSQGEKITFDNVVCDIVNSYNWLYDNYKPLGGKGENNLEKIKENPNYLNFIVKMRFLYHSINNTYSSEVAYPWVTYLFTGLKSEQVMSMTYQAVKVSLKKQLDSSTRESPDISTLPTQYSGKISITLKNGIRFIPEMQELYNKFVEYGFDVWICSATFTDVIKEVCSNPEFGYNCNPEHVLAMELERDSDEKILPVFRKGYFQTQHIGKFQTINKFLADSSGKYGYPPVFIAGDSEGDQEMLNNFTIKTGLIINRQKGKGNLLGQLSTRAVKSYGSDTAVYLLQGRDDTKGQFISNQGNVDLDFW